MVCSRYPREYRYYETILKRKCLRKLRYNVWERKTKWVLLKKADDHYRLHLLRRHFNSWMEYLNQCYKEIINNRAADALYQEKLKSRGISALKKNVEQSWTLMRICRRKFEWNLKYKCWHQWKHYAEKRLKVKEVKLLADRIREERLRIRYFYLWLFCLKEKQSLENASEVVAARYSRKLTEKYFKAWKIFTTKQVWKAKIESLAVTCYEDKLKERFIRCWKQHTFQKRRYRYQLKIIEDFYEGYLVKNSLSRWQTAYKKVKRQRKIYNFNLAVSFHERKLLERSFHLLQKAGEAKRQKQEKMEQFREAHARIYLSCYLNLWTEKRTEKMLWNRLESNATKWRQDFLLETYILKLFEKYQKSVAEQEEMEKVVKYSNAIITERAFRGWRKVTEKKIIGKIELENASKLFSDRLVKKTFDKWKKLVERRSRKKMAAEYYRFTLLSRVMNQWSFYFSERKVKLEEAKNLEEKLNKRVLKNALDFWKNEVDVSKSKQKSAIEFFRNSNLLKAFRAWKKVTRIKAANKNRYNRNKSLLNGIIIKNSIGLWHEMLSLRRDLQKKLGLVERKREKRCLECHFGAWRRFAEKKKRLRQTAELLPQLRSDVLLEQCLDSMWNAVRRKKVLNEKMALARKNEEKMLKRRYLTRWTRFVCWKKERIMRCVPEDGKLTSVQDFKGFVPAGSGARRMPLIPDYLKTAFGYGHFEGQEHHERRKIRDRAKQMCKI